MHSCRVIFDKCACLDYFHICVLQNTFIRRIHVHWHLQVQKLKQPDSVLPELTHLNMYFHLNMVCLCLTKHAVPHCSPLSVPTAMDSASAKGNLCSDTGKPCNPCLDATKACNLNDTCKKQRTALMATCNPATPIQQAHEPCNRKRCHRGLRQFFDRVQTEFSYPLLFCSCRDKACAERRRQTIMPACSYEEKTKPNCLELRRTCRSDPLCR